eukprot:4988208-Pyramimonas_sp.AAC.1
MGAFGLGGATNLATPPRSGGRHALAHALLQRARPATTSMAATLGSLPQTKGGTRQYMMYVRRDRGDRRPVDGQVGR